MQWKYLLKRLVRKGFRDGAGSAGRALRGNKAKQVAGESKAKNAEHALVRQRHDAQFDGPRRRHRRLLAPASQSTHYPGDFTGHLAMVYDPHPNGLPDPGEVVWTWVPYEEDHLQGKDRPVLLIGRDGNWLLGLQVTSKDHDRDAAQEARAGRHWVDIGQGDWDRRRRPSEVRINRFIRIDPSAVRRIGAVLPKERFDEVAEAVARYS